MAWNEPGGGKNNDPWGGGNNQGPPDLDEAFKKFMDKFGGLFGGGSGSGAGGPSPVSGGMIGVLVVVALLVWAGFGVYQVDEKERAVILRLGKYQEIAGPGLHWNPPLIDHISIVRVTEERQYASRGMMLTEDENIVELPLTVQYNVSDPKAFVLNVSEPEISLQHATDSALRHVVGSSKLDDVVSTGREKLGDDVKLRLQTLLNDYGTGIQVVNINIQEAKPPTEVKAAYDDVIKAREDKERLINESQAYANGIIPEARGGAQRMIEEASGYREKVILEAIGEAERFEKLLTEYAKAPGVTRERLYLDAVESVMSSSSKVMIDVEGGNNMMYLPLDKLTQSGASVGGSSRPASTSMDNYDISEIADEVIKKLRREQSANRRREVR
jgi:membrane protease subunit HflK